MDNFVALYRGTSLQTGYLIGYTGRPDIVLQVASVLYPPCHSGRCDNVLRYLNNAFLTALELIKDEANKEISRYS